MKYAMRRFFRLLRPLLVMAAIVTWVSGHTQEAHSAASTAKLPIEVSQSLDGGLTPIPVNSPSPSVKSTTASH
jgi:hypothetical protein